MPRIPSQVRRFIASIPVIVLLTPLSPALAQQKPAPPPRPSQVQFEEHVKDLERRLNDAEQKAASAAMEKDYITRVQKQYETYYEKAFNTQIIILTILGLIIGVVGKFGLDRVVQHKLGETSVQLRTEFNQQLGKEAQELREANVAQLKALEASLNDRITEQEWKLRARADYGHIFVQGVAFAIGGRHATARKEFRQALAIYKTGKPKQLIEKQGATALVENIFLTFKKEDEETSAEKAKKELEDELYNDLEDELALAAVNLPWLAPLLKERKSASGPQAAEPKAAEAAATAAAPDSASSGDR
jgi:hypothetical protein